MNSNSRKKGIVAHRGRHERTYLLTIECRFPSRARRAAERRLRRLRSKAGLRPVQSRFPYDLLVAPRMQVGKAIENSISSPSILIDRWLVEPLFSGRSFLSEFLRETSGPTPIHKAKSHADGRGRASEQRPWSAFQRHEQGCQTDEIQYSPQHRRTFAHRPSISVVPISCVFVMYVTSTSKLFFVDASTFTSEPELPGWKAQLLDGKDFR